jgi:hypothetical protein
MKRTTLQPAQKTLVDQDKDAQTNQYPRRRNKPAVAAAGANDGLKQ